MIRVEKLNELEKAVFSGSITLAKAQLCGYIHLIHIKEDSGAYGLYFRTSKSFLTEKDLRKINEELKNNGWILQEYKGDRNIGDWLFVKQ